MFSVGAKTSNDSVTPVLTPVSRSRELVTLVAGQRLATRNVSTGYFRYGR